MFPSRAPLLALPRERAAQHARADTHSGRSDLGDPSSNLSVRSVGVRSVGRRRESAREIREQLIRVLEPDREADRSVRDG